MPAAPAVRIYGGAPGASGGYAHALLAGFPAFTNVIFRSAPSLAVGDVNRDGANDLVVGAGEGGGSRVTGYRGADFADGAAPERFGFDTFPGFNGGVFVG